MLGECKRCGRVVPQMELLIKEVCNYCEDGKTPALKIKKPTKKRKYEVYGEDYWVY